MVKHGVTNALIRHYQPTEFMLNLIENQELMATSS
jgi:hypothetical protein